MRKTFVTSSLLLAILFCLSLVYVEATGKKPESPSVGQKLVGTWHVTLRFPVCGVTCNCPGGVPNIPIPALHTYSSDGTMEEMSGGTLFRSDALGSWEHIRDQEYSARYKFFVFNAAGAPTLSEVVTSQIDVQEGDAFEATAMFDLFAADGTPIPNNCQINITGTRF